jgi:hypothetical protein
MRNARGVLQHVFFGEQFGRKAHFAHLPHDTVQMGTAAFGVRAEV